MKRKWKRVIAGFVVGVVICTSGGLGQTVRAETTEFDFTETQENADETSTVVASGNCGNNDENVKYVLDSDGVLTIGGSGGMKSYSDYNEMPWYDKIDSVKTIVVENGVTSIGTYTFSHCSRLTSVSISTSVTCIGSYAFMDCSSLANVDIPQGVTSIGDYAFSYCNGLTNMRIPSSVTDIGAFAFMDCSSLASVDISQGVAGIGEGAFMDCSSLASVRIPSSVTSIGAFAFQKCDSLISAGPIGGGYDYEFGWEETIPAHAFEYCSGLINVDIPQGITGIGEQAFFNCSGLTSVQIPSSVTSIGNYVFCYCSSLTNVSIPSGVADMGEGIFGDCSGLTSAGPIGGGYDYEFGWEEAIPAHAFDHCSSLTSVQIPSSVVRIGDSAFKNCSGLTSVDIPSGVTRIGDHAFSGCSGLISVDVPSGVMSIEREVFYGCHGLLSIKILNSACEICDWNETIPEGAVIYGYAGSTAQSYAEKYKRTFKVLDPLQDVVVVSLEAVKGKTEYTVGDILNVDDLTVTAHYADGSTKAVTGYTTNASELDLSAAGTKTLTVTYEENGVSVEASIEIVVKEKSVITETYTVTFDANGGAELNETSRTVEKGKPLGTLPSVKRDGYTLKGWYTEKEGGQEATQDTIITEDMILYACWELDSTKPDTPDGPAQTTYKVTFDLQGKGEPLEEYTGYSGIISGSAIKEPTAPEAEGYRFTGWYKDTECKVKWDFTKDVVNADTTLYAGWKKIPSSDENGILPGDAPADGKIPDGIWIAGIEEYTYTGQVATPQVRVYNHDKRLVKGKDYTISYKNNKKAASSSDKNAPTVIVKGKGNYTGTVSRTFTIKQAELTKDCLIAASNYFAGSAYVPVVMLDGNILKSKTDYALTYYQDGQEKKLKKQPTAEGSYSMQIVGKGSCKGEIIFPYTIVKDGRVSIAKGRAVVPNIVYGGSEPSVSLIVAGETLQNGTDYTVKFTNTGAKGTATAIFTGTGKYTGILKKTFKVKAALLPENCISVDASVAYEKGGAKPEVTVTANGMKLVEGTDYTIAYSKNAKLGDAAKVTVKGKGNYSGSRYAFFKVTEKDLTEEGVQVYVSDVVTGKKPAVMVYDTNGKKLSSGSDYEAQVDAASHQVTVTGGKNGLYTASAPIVQAYRELEKDHVITSVSLNKRADGFPAKFQYTITGVQLDKSWLTVKAEKNILPTEKFEVIGYINNDSKSTATVFVQGKGEYGGTKALNFKIQSQSILSIVQ